MRLTPAVYLVGGGNFGFNLSDAFDSHLYIVDGGSERYIEWVRSEVRSGN